MKLLTKEEEQAHYIATLKGGSAGGAGGLVLGVLGIYGATVRYPAFRQLTLPLRAFLITSSTTFGAIVTADHFSRAYQASTHPDEGFEDETSRARAEAKSRQTNLERFMDFGKEHRYQIVGGSWVASMAIALGLVGRSPYLSTQQKLVQARVYAQGLTVAVLIATAVFEAGDQSKGQSRWETVKVMDPNDPEHKHLIEKNIHHERYAGEDQWRDMVEAEEDKMNARKEAVKEQEKADEAAGKHQKKADAAAGKGKTKEKEHHESKKEDKKEEGKKAEKKEKAAGGEK